MSDVSPYIHHYPSLMYLLALKVQLMRKKADELLILGRLLVVSAFECFVVKVGNESVREIESVSIIYKLLVIWIVI